MMPETTPQHLGYRMPAEWEPHQATWLAWPHNRITWPERLDEVQETFLQMIAALQGQEVVHLLVDDATTESTVRQCLHQRGTGIQHLVIHQHPTVDAWLRDSGPIFVTTARTDVPPVALNDWHFNAWGGKYAELAQDTFLPQQVATWLQLPRFQPDIVLEGGSIDVNGLGTCLTTEQCLLNPNRNPHLRRHDLERYLYAYLGVRHTIWLGEGIVGDDTDGHVDDIARFVNPTTVVCVLEDDPADPNYAPLQDNYRRLRAATDQQGQPLRVVTLPMPGIVGTPEERLPASYANFYIANGVVLVPIYQHPNDARALAILQELFPERRVLGLPCNALVGGLGALHCVTQQQPASPSLTASR